MGNRIVLHRSELVVLVVKEEEVNTLCLLEGVTGNVGEEDLQMAPESGQGQRWFTGFG